MAGINYTISADASKANREMSSFEKKTRRVVDGIAKGFNERIGHKLFDGMLDAARSVPAKMKEMIDLGGRLSDQIAKTGASGEGLVILERALKNNGVAGAKVDDILRKMQDSFSGLNEDQKSTADAFDMLGLSMENLREMDPVDAFKEIASAFRNIKSNADRTSAAMDIFGRSGQDVITLFEDQTAFEQAEKELGNIPEILTKNATKLDQLSDRFGNLGTAFDAIGLTLAVELMPLIDDVTKRIQNIDFESLASDIGDVVKKAADLAPKIVLVGAAIKGIQLAKFFGTMVAGLAKSITLWAAETAAVEKNTAAKIKNAAAGTLAGGKGPGGAGSAAVGGATVAAVGRFPQAAAVAATAFGGFQIGKMIGDLLAPILIKSAPSEFVSNIDDRISGQSDTSRNDKVNRQNEQFRIQTEIAARVANEKNNLKILEIEKKANEEAKKKKKIISSIKDEYEKTLQILKARISGDSKLLEQEKIRKQVEEERMNSAKNGFMLSEDAAMKIVDLKNKAEAAEKKRETASQEEMKLLEEELANTKSALEDAMTRSGITAVSSMQRIGGGGGVSTELDIQKTQTKLQEQMVSLLSEIKERQKPQSISDY